MTRARKVTLESKAFRVFRAPKGIKETRGTGDTRGTGRPRNGGYDSILYENINCCIAGDQGEYNNCPYKDRD